MNKLILITTILIATNAFMAYDVLNDASDQKASGAAPGYCGDPAGGNQNCTTCHSGPTATSISELITSNVPVEGYTPNTTYTITATITRAGHSKFGFEVSPQDSSGTFIGTLVNTSSETQLTGSGNNYITHTSTGTGGTGSKTWTFNWTSPAQGTGKATMYGAFNVTNSSNNFNGDTIYISTLVIPENTTVGIANISSNEQNISVYPNPACDIITIKASDILLGSPFIITDQTGRQVLIGKLNNKTTLVNISQFETGVYFFQVGEKRDQTFKFMKQ